MAVAVAAETEVAVEEARLKLLADWAAAASWPGGLYGIGIGIGIDIDIDIGIGIGIPVLSGEGWAELLPMAETGDPAPWLLG